MNNPKLNQPDVETTTTKPIIETQCTSCSKYPLKNYKINFKKQEELLKEFEDLGYILRVNNDNTIILHIKEKNEVLRIYKKDKSYSKYFVCWNSKDKMPVNLTLNEHQLLTKLFIALRWIDD